nr:alpha-L-fucosidase 2-like isoform X2 [Tanacetum cinerariifolium]
YLLISSSRAGGLPANLQGVWNESLTPSWGSKYTTNINLEMNYWPAEVLGLSACAVPLVQFIDEAAQAGQATAKNNYDAPGWYPVLKSAAEFYLSFLTKDARTGWLISTPSNSPEHGGLVAGPTMDHQLIRELFKTTAKAASVLRVDDELQKELITKAGQLAPNQIGKHGQLQEWLEDKDDPADTHRHQSHLWGVFPGTDITWSEPKL